MNTTLDSVTTGTATHRILLALQRSDQPLTVAELAAQCDLRPQAVYNVVAVLAPAAVIDHSIRRSGAKGRPQTTWALTPAYRAAFCTL